MRKVQFSESATQDLDEIAKYIARSNSDAALRLVQRVQETCDRLAEAPGIGVSRDELQSSLRCFPVGRYVVYYLPIGEGITVVRVLHGARDVSRLF